MAGRVEPGEERPLVREDRQLVAADHVEVPQLVVEEGGRPGAGDDGTGVDRLDVSHRPRELALDLGRAQRPLAVVGHVVDHRVPDRTRVLQPMQVDRAVGAQCRQVGRAAVVLVHQPRDAVGHDHRRVAAGAVGDRDLGVDRDRQPGRDLELLAVDGADELGEPERGERALLLAGRVAGQQDRDVAPQVRAQPGLVVVVGVEVRDVEEVSRLDPRQQVVAELVVAREDEPRTEERRDEPRIAQDRPGRRLDQHPGVADRRRAHASRRYPRSRRGRRQPRRGRSVRRPADR